MRSKVSQFASLLLLLAGVALRIDPAHTTPFDRDSAVRTLAVLGSSAAERACLGVLVAPQFLVAPAHCVASYQRRQGQQLTFAAFGFQMAPAAPPNDDDEVIAPLTSGFFNETERISVTAIALHPEFAFEIDTQSFMKNDWAVLTLEKAPAFLSSPQKKNEEDTTTAGDLKASESVTGSGSNTGNESIPSPSEEEPVIPPPVIEQLPFLDDALIELYNMPSNFGALFVDSESLALTWVEYPRINNPLETCGFTPPSLSLSPSPEPEPETSAPASVSSSSSAASVEDGEPDEDFVPEIPNDVVCVTQLYDDAQPLPTFASNWLGTLLLTEHYTDPGYFFVGFGTSHADLPGSQSFTWVEATGPEFLGKPLIPDAKWIHVPPYSPLIGYDVPVLNVNMKFMSGIRTVRKGQNYCGASLIAPSFVLTAAHCVDESDVLPWVSIGSLKTAGAEFGEQIRVAKVTRHPGFSEQANMNDLAVLELKYPSVAAPVKLFNSHPIPASGQIFGYGVTTSWGLKLSDVLRFVDVNIVASNQICMQDLQMDIDKSMFCAGGQAGKDACDGDSGGPLVVIDERTGDTALLGVISFGRGCGAEYLPGVYANVSMGDTFISSIVQEAKWTLVKEATGGQGGVSPSPSSPATPSPVNPGTPSPANSSTEDRGQSGGGGTAASSPAGTDNDSSGHNSADTSSEYVLPDSLAPAVKDAVISFLIGDNSHISNAVALSLLGNSKIVFKSSESLASLEAIITKFNEKPLHQRHVRFTDGKGHEC